MQDLGALLRWLRKVPPFDLIVYAGDDVQRFRPRRSVNYCERLARTARYGFAAIIGNDDSTEARRLICGPGVHELHTSPLRIGRYLFVGVEGAPILPGVNLGPTLYREREIGSHLALHTQKAQKSTVIIVSHAPPRGCLDESKRFGVRQIGSVALRRFVRANKNVRLVICGHSHLCGGRSRDLDGALVVNIASHDDDTAPLRLAEIELASGGVTCSNIHELRSPLKIADVPGISFAYGRALARVGIRSLKAMANANPGDIGAAISWSAPKAAVFAYRAQSLITGQPIVVRRPKLPPAPRLYIDIETDVQQSYCWLVGVGADDTEYVKQFFAARPDKERSILKAFAHYVSNRPEKAALHFSGSDLDRRLLMDRLAHYGLAVPTVLRASIDAHKDLFYAVAIPATSFGLKPVATALGYQFAFPEITGFDVGYGYQEAISKRRRVPEQFLAYNRDDVLALRYVVQELLDRSASRSALLTNRAP